MKSEIKPLLIAFALCVSLGDARTGNAADAAAPLAPSAGAGSAKAKTKVVGPPEVAWADMTAKQRNLYMKVVVTPKMKPMFREFDPKAYKTFNCATCHGNEAKARKFKMPSPDMHALPSTPEAFQAALKAKPTWPKWTKFMAEKVTPEMAALLGRPAFDPKKPDPTAFSCNGCHKLEDK